MAAVIFSLVLLKVSSYVSRYVNPVKKNETISSHGQVSQLAPKAQDRELYSIFI